MRQLGTPGKSRAAVSAMPLIRDSRCSCVLARKEASVFDVRSRSQAQTWDGKPNVLLRFTELSVSSPGVIPRQHNHVDQFFGLIDRWEHDQHPKRVCDYDDASHAE